VICCRADQEESGLMLSTSDLAVIAVLAAGIDVADIVRIAQQQPSEILLAQLMPVMPAPQQPHPDIQAGRDWLDRKSADREREFLQQQRQRGEERRDLLLERRLDAARGLRREGDSRR
jgi:hypothetical protein